MIARKKLFINLGLILICGTVALSLPIIVNNLQHRADASTHEEFTHPTDPTADWELVSVFVGDRYQNQVDAYVIWQIKQQHGNQVIATWDEIYAELSTTNPLTYDSEHLTLTRYGLVYRGLRTPEDYQALFASGYQSTVIYQNHSCVLTLQ